MITEVAYDQILMHIKSPQFMGARMDKTGGNTMTLLLGNIRIVLDKECAKRVAMGITHLLEHEDEPLTGEDSWCVKDPWDEESKCAKPNW